MRNHKFKIAIAFPAIFVVGLTFELAGCHSSNPQPTTQSTAAPDSSPIARMMAEPTEKKAGSELWAENCTRCHNARPPQYYSDVQWDIIVHHMRLRADLTGQEARAIAEFLKAAN
jgi:hypothetical protein